MAKEVHKWEIRKGRIPYLESSVEMCGYDKRTLASMKRAGYNLYCDGKLYKEERKSASKET